MKKLIEKLLRPLALGVATLALAAGCASSNSNNGRMNTVDQLNLKRQILTEYGAQLDGEQQCHIYYSDFKTPDDAYAMVEDFLDYNARKAAMEDPERPRSASDVLLTPDSSSGN